MTHLPHMKNSSKYLVSCEWGSPCFGQQFVDLSDIKTDTKNWIFDQSCILLRLRGLYTGLQKCYNAKYKVKNCFWLTSSSGLQFCLLQHLQVGPCWFGLEPVCDGADELCNKQAHRLQDRGHSHHDCKLDPRATFKNKECAQRWTFASALGTSHKIMMFLPCQAANIRVVLLCALIHVFVKLFINSLYNDHDFHP